MKKRYYVLKNKEDVHVKVMDENFFKEMLKHGWIHVGYEEDGEQIALKQEEN